MDTILSIFIGFGAGYLLGAKSGTGSFSELRESWKVISSSEDFRAMRSGAPLIVMAMVKQWLGGLTGSASHD